MRELTTAVVIGSWMVFCLGFLVAKVRRPPRRPVRKDRTALPGFVVQTAGVAVVFFYRRPETGYPAVLIPGVALAVASAWFAWWAFHRLGKQLGIEAELVEDHELVTSGPFAVVRHPVYTSVIGLATATGILLSTWPALLAGLSLTVAGTEWRVRVEERLLAARFGAAFDAYRVRVRAYLPLPRSV